MREGRRAGRPRSASREILEEAACELFLEKGYAATSVADITQRAGVSRNTFFNYIPTKSDLLWTAVDDALEDLAAELAAATDSSLSADSSLSVDLPMYLGGGSATRGKDGARGEDGARDEDGATGEGDATGEGGARGEGGATGTDGRASAGETGAAIAEVRGALLRWSGRLEPGTVVLAFANAEPMGVAEELEESAARRQRRAALVIGGHLRRRGTPELEAEVVGAALAGAFLAALRAWARSTPGRTSFTDVLARALGAVPLA